MNRIGDVLRYQKTLITLWALLVVLMLSGCDGGGGLNSYTDLDAEYYQNDATANTVVDAATVKAWVDNGMKTDSGQRVVIIDCVPNPAGVYPNSDMDSWFAGDVGKIKVNMAAQYGGTTAPQYNVIDTLNDLGYLGHIPGAIINVSHEGYEVTARNDGPILADHEVGTGSLIDQMIQGSGITKDDVLVFTTSRLDYPGFCPARLWWTLRYWGIARDHLLVLNGGNKAYVNAGGTLQTGVTLPITTPSTFCPSTLAQRFLDTRISLGELISLVDSGRTSLPDDDPNQVIVLDARQPPAALFFKDGNENGIPEVFEAVVDGYSYDATTKDFSNGTAHITLSEFLFDADKLGVVFKMANPPVDVEGPYFGINAAPVIGPIAIPLGAKPAAFEGIIRGAKITKTPTTNITIPTFTNADGSYKTKAELLPLFATAGIDGTKPIVTYCNSGALAAIYYYVLQEVCGFDDVTMYDGSWQEWASLTAFEPATTKYVMTDDYNVFPAYPAGSPKVPVFAGMNNYFEYDVTADQFVDTRTGAVIDTDIVAGGGLDGKITWDTITRSAHVMFRPTASLNSSPDDFSIITYKSATDWPSFQMFPNYSGFGDEISIEDEEYEGSSSTTSGGDAPTAFTPIGGGC